MGMYTYLDAREKELYRQVSDKEVNELYKELIKVDNKYYIREYIQVTKRFLRKPKTTFNYSLYYDTYCNIEFRYMNIGNSKLTIMAYMYGFINGRMEVKDD